MTRGLHYWEAVFFTGLFGAIALYPAAQGFFPRVLSDAPLFTLLIATGIAAFLTLVVYFEFHERRRTRYVTACAFNAALTVAFLGTLTHTLTPQALLWFLDALLALFTFGYIVSKHLFQRVERDFLRRAHHIILTGFVLNALTLLFMAVLTVFPAGLIALITGASLFTLFHHETA